MKRVVPIIVLFLLGQSIKAQTVYTWNGSVSANWNVAGNWTPNGIPGTSDNVKIVTATNMCQLSANAGVWHVNLSSGTLDLGGNTLTVGGDTALFSTGTVQNGTITVSGANYAVFGNGPVTMNCTTNITSGTITFKNTTFQGATSITKTGASNDASSGGNIFNGVAVFTNAGSGYLMLGNGNPDQFNGSTTFNNTGTANLIVANNSTGNVFNGTATFNNSTTSSNGIYIGQNSSGTTFNNSIVVTSTGGTGVQFDASGACTSSLAAGQIISIGSTGFSTGTLLLRQFTQTGATAQNITLTGAANLTFGPSATFAGNVTATSPTFFLNGCTFNGTTNLTKTGTTGDFNNGGNTFNGICAITNSGSSYWVLGNSSPDIWNTDVTFTDNGSERLLPCWASAGNQFNGNINVNTAGSALGIQFCGANNTATATLAAGKTIQAGSGGLTAGFLYLRQFTQAGSAAINITATGTSVVYLGPSSSFGGAVTVTAPDIWAQGATYNSAASFTKTGGSSNHNNQYQNIFNSTCTINQQSSTGYFMLGYNSNDLFNDNITVTSTGTGGIYLGWQSGTGTPTLAAGKTILVGSAGFSAGFLWLNTFTQQGNAAMNLSFTGSSTYLVFARNSAIGGNLTTSTPDIFFNGCTFNGDVNATKTGANNDNSSGGDIFQDSTTISITGAGYLTLGTSTPDTWNNYALFNASGSSVLGVAWGSAGNTFNGNIAVSSTGSATGVQFCGGNNTATATLASGYSILTGPAGFSSGTLLLRQFTQSGSASTNITLTGATTLLQMGPLSTIGGNFTAVSPRILLQTTVFSDSVSLTKTGSTGEWSYGGNTFNSTLTVNQQGAGYFGFANGAADIYNGDVYANNNSTERIIFGNNPAGNQFNGNIILTQIGSSVGIAFGWSSTTNETQAVGKTISIGAAGFSTGYLQIERFTQSGSTAMNLPLTGTASLTFGPTSTIGGNLTSTSGSLFFNGCTFMDSVNCTKTGATSDWGSGGNIFNGVTTMTNAGSGYLLFGSTNPDQFNSTTTFNNTGSNNIYVAWNSTNNIFNGTTTFNNSPTGNTLIYVSSNSSGTVFNGNIVVTSTNGQGVQFCSGNTTATATLAAGNTISVGAGGFSAGTLLLRQFTQIGATAQSLTLTGAGNLSFGPSSAFGGNVTTISPTLLFNGCTFTGTLSATKNGSTSDASAGNNIFNGVTTMTNAGSGYLMFGNGNPDQFNSTSTFNNTSSNNIYVAWNSANNIFNGTTTFNNAPTANTLIYVSSNSAGTVFNGNIVVTSTSGQGVQFCSSNTTASATLASGNTISVGSGGFTTGTLLLRQFTHIGATAQSLTLTGAGNLSFGPSSAFGGNVTTISPTLLFNGCTFTGTLSATKNGSTSDASAGNNIFNGITTMTNAGSGYFMFGNGNPDQFNSTSTFNNTGTNNIYVANNSSNNVFGGVTTFNNTPTGNNLIYVSPNSAGTVFNSNIVVTSTNGLGVQFCTGNPNATATLSAGNTISVGAGGFSAGTLLLRSFTQTGATAQSLTLTGSGNLTFGPSSSIGGNITTVSPTLLFVGCTFGGTVTATKNGTTNDWSTGNNVFDGAFTVTNTGSGFVLMGNGNPDLWQSTATFNNFSSASHMYVAYNSSGNTFNSDVIFNNQPGATGLWIYSNTNGANTQFNGNIFVENVGGAGVYFGQGTGSATLAGSGSVIVGSTGFASGGLVLQNFTQSNAGVAQNITLTGTAYVQYGINSTFNAPVTSSSPGLLFNGATFNGTVNATKTGISNDASTGNNTFNGVSTFTDNGTGYLLMSNSGPDVYNANTSFVQNNTGKIEPDYNYNGTYAGNVTITSPAASAITFGAGSGTATFAGTAGQSISVTSGTPVPVFARLVINNTGSGVTLVNTSISVSNNLVMSAGLLNTTTSYLLTMLNGSTTAAGNALSTSFVNGPMQYQKSSSGASTLNFPIGSGPDCRPVVLTINQTSSGTLYTYQAQLFDAPAVGLDYIMPPSVDEVSDVHYYTINRTNSAGVNTPSTGLSGNQTIQIFFGANDYVSNGGTLTIVKTLYSSPGYWFNIGGTGGPVYNAGADLSGSITSTSSPSAFNSFSTFALADQIGGGNTLPIELLYFKALPNNNVVDLQWATSTESNNSYFTIEKSRDGVDFVTVEKVPTLAPDGNSAVPLNYTAQDPNPYSGVSYYRLVQTDLNGNEKYSAVVSVDFLQTQAVSVYPNPARNILNVTGLNVNMTSMQVQWFDLGGKLLAQGTTSVAGGMATLTVGLSNGYYLLKLIAPDGSVTVHNVIILK
jgi:hypothetical protein